MKKLDERKAYIIIGSVLFIWLFFPIILPTLIILGVIAFYVFKPALKKSYSRRK